jgi:ribonuclease P protein component
MRMPSLAAPRDFQRVLSQGRRTRSRGIQVSLMPHVSPQLPSRLGLSVRSARAVDRNRARRRLRAAVQGCVPPTGWDLVIGADRTAATMKFQELEASVCDAVAELTR